MRGAAAGANALLAGSVNMLLLNYSSIADHEKTGRVRILAAADDVGLALRDGDVLAVAQKIVSKAEDRYAVLDDVAPSERARELAAICRKDPRVIELVLAESRAVLRAVPGLIVVEDRRGLVLANAGVASRQPVADWV